MTKLRILATVWLIFGCLTPATATNQYSAKAIYDACVSSKIEDRAFCFGYLEAAALTWFQAGGSYYLMWGSTDAADVNLICREGRAIQILDLVNKFVEHIEAHAEAKEQLAIQLVYDLVCNER